MKIPAFFTEIQEVFEKQQTARKGVFGASDQARTASKRAIFALHRGDRAGAEKLLDEAKEALKKAELPMVRHAFLRQEGAYLAAVEEFVEAMFFFEYVRTGTFRKADKRFSDPSAFIGGLSDATGEIVRYAVREAGQGNTKVVGEAREAVETAVEFLLAMDLTGNLRQKVDQAKRNPSTLEQMVYELRLSRSVTAFYEKESAT